MGFMGLKHWIESDNAADLMREISTSTSGHIADILIRAHDEQANCYNTPGPINVALVLLGLEEKFNGSIFEALLFELEERSPKFCVQTAYNIFCIAQTVDGTESSDFGDSVIDLFERFRSLINRYPWLKDKDGDSK